MKKLYFFNLTFRKYKMLASIIALVLAIVIVEFLFNERGNELSLVMGIVYLPIISYWVFQVTRKNAYTWVNDGNFKFKLDGHLLEAQAQHLTAFWIEDDVLHIQRVNRVDTFKIDHIRKEDTNKLMALLKEQQTLNRA